MDHATFQYELVQLKQRVSEMAAVYTQRQQALENQNLQAQLLDARKQMCAIERFLSKQDTEAAYHLNYSGPTNVNFPSSFLPSEPLLHENMILPSPSLFWSLFNSLRTDVKSLDTRVGDLERNVSDLEDRIDAQTGPHTPASSTTSSAAGSSFHKKLQGAAARAKYGTNVSEACSVNCISTKAEHFGGPHSDLRHFTSSVSAVLPQAKHDNSGSKDSGGGVRLSNSTLQGVAFRDKEITDLEELVKTAQDKLRQSEEAATESALQISELRDRNAELEEMLWARTRDLDSHARRLFQKLQQLDEVCAEADSKDAALDRLGLEHRDLHERYLQQRDELGAVKARLGGFYERYAVREREVKQSLASSEEDICKLRNLCETKNMILIKQEGVIARGVALMQEKDQEIEELRDKLQALRVKPGTDILGSHSSQQVREHQREARSQRGPSTGQVSDEDAAQFARSTGSVYSSAGPACSHPTFLLESQGFPEQRAYQELPHGPTLSCMDNSQRPLMGSTAQGHEWVAGVWDACISNNGVNELRDPNDRWQWRNSFATNVLSSRATDRSYLSGGEDMPAPPLPPRRRTLSASRIEASETGMRRLPPPSFDQVDSCAMTDRRLQAYVEAGEDESGHDLTPRNE